MIADESLLGEEVLNKAIKDSIMTQNAVALFCGSALKNKGI